MNQRVIAIAAGAAVVILLAWYLVLWSPRGSELSKQQKRRDAAESQVQTLQTQLGRLQAAQRGEAVKQAKLERLRSAIPDDPGLAQFILDANDAANRAGINFISIAPSPPSAASATPGGASTSGGAAASRPAEIKLAMTISGSYFQVLDFINRLEGLPRIVVIDSVNVTSGGGTASTGATAGATGGLNVSLSGRMFVSQVPSGFSTGAGQAGGTTGGTTTTVAGGTTTTVAGGTTTTTPAGSSTSSTTAPR